MFVRFFRSLFLYFFFRYIIRVACQHFCKFREGGSNFEYTHVHFTIEDPPNFLKRGGVTGIGHDDRTNPDDPHHNTVSRGSSCEFVTKPDGTAVRVNDYNVKCWFTVYFHAPPIGPETPCPEGYFRVNCKCGPMCYTLMREAFDVWYRNRVRAELGLSPLKLKDVIEEPPREPGGDGGD